MHHHYTCLFFASFYLTLCADCPLVEHDEHPCEGDGDECITAGDIRKRIEKLPNIVKAYMKAVLHDLKNYTVDEIIPIARSLRMEQHGEFLLNGEFVPFTATQEFRTRYKHAGFVWNAVMKSKSCIPNLPMSVTVCDAYIDGHGVMKAQIPGGIPAVNQRDTPQLNQGELLRWLAEATLYPLALLPPLEDKKSGEEDTVKWLESENDDNSAILEFNHLGTKVQMTFLFDAETNLVKSIKATRPRAVGNTYEMTLWEGFCSKYELHGGLMIPTHMEAGWYLEDGADPQIYFKGDNHNFVYLMNHPCGHCGKCEDVKHAE